MSTMEKAESFVVTYKNEKYDIADFLNRHPGGLDVLLPFKDKDMTKEFDHIGHSDGAKMILRKRLIKKDGAAATDDHVNEETTTKIDRKFIVKKLFTEEDTYNTHKTLGFLSLLSYIYRYFYVLPTTGVLGLGHDTFTYVTLLLHTLLSCSSLIFHVLRHRIKDNPLIIYEEYRLHAILFTVKALIASLYGLHGHHVPEPYRHPLLIGLMLASHGVADWITAKHGVKGVTAVRNEDTSSGIIKFGMRSYAFYQLLGQACFLRYSPNIADLAFNTLIAIQSSAFLMTLKRKNIIDWPMHAFGYSVALILSAGYIVWINGLTFAVYISVVFIMRTQLRMNKYLIWTIWCGCIHFILPEY